MMEQNVQDKKDIPLKEIADRMNFSSLSHFSRYVQKQLGMSPSAYRNRAVGKS